MSKRSKRPKDEVQIPAAAEIASDSLARSLAEAQPADHSRAEAKLLVGGESFTQFDSWIDGQLEQLVDRWIGVAAPAAATSRRAIFSESQRHSEQA